MEGNDTLCPRCKVAEQGVRLSITDNKTRICDDCAAAEVFQTRLIGHPVPQYTWPVNIVVRRDVSQHAK